MSDMPPKERTDQVRHEPIVSDTLERNADGTQRATNQGKERSESSESARLDQSQDTASKRHGDALAEGSGNRHGVHDADERPDTCA